MPATEEPEEHRVVGHDRFDDITWRGTLDECRPLRELRSAGRDVHRGFGGLLADLHAGLYKSNPEMVAPMPKEAAWQAAAVEKSWSTKEWAQTRETSVLDEMLSAIGTMAAGQAALDELKKQQLKKPASSEESDSIQLTPQQTRAIARAAAQAAKKEVSETEAVLAAWGLESGQLEHLPLGRRVELAQRLTREQKMKDLAAMVGAMRALASGLHRRRVTAKPAEVVGVEPGNDVRRLLPSELALLAHPVLRYEGVRRLVTGQALQWQKATRERQGRGPLIVLCDVSGSTKGRQEALIKGIALGLLEIAHRQKRGFAGVVFSSAGQFQTFEFPAGKMDPEALLGFATTFYNGGTDWETPLREALRLQSLSPYKHGDVVLITDGLCGLSEEFKAELAAQQAKRDLRVLGVLAQAGAHSGDAMAFCDQVIVTSDLNKAAAEIMGGVVEDRA